MRNTLLKLTLAISLLCTSLYAFTQTNSEPSKTIGANFRNLWLGNSLEVILKKPLKQDKWRRRVFQVDGEHQESSNALTYQPGTPDPYRSNLNSRVFLSVELGTENHKRIIDDLHFYHGPIYRFFIGANHTRTLSGSTFFPEYTKSVNHNFGFGVGYLGGIRYQLNNRFGVQMDNVLLINFAGSVFNQTNYLYRSPALEEEINQTATDQLRTNINIPRVSISRIWLTYSF